MLSWRYICKHGDACHNVFLAQRLEPLLARNTHYQYDAYKKHRKVSLIGALLNVLLLGRLTGRRPLDFEVNHFMVQF